MTPSLPTFSIASAIRLPISLSLFAEMAPTWAISFRPAVGTEIFFSSSTTDSTARSMPRLSDIGFEPAVTDLSPSRKIAWASTVAVVVPSPARSDVLVATTFQLHLGAAVFPVHHAVPHLELERDDLPLLAPAGSHSEDFALDRLLLRCVGDVQPTLHLLGLLDRPDRHPVGEGVNLQLGLARGRSSHMPDLQLCYVSACDILRLALWRSEC